MFKRRELRQDFCKPCRCRLLTWLSSHYVFGLQALVTHHDGEFDALTLDQHSVAFTSNGPEMYEYIVAAVPGNKAEPLGGIEPLDRASFASSGWGGRLRLLSFARCCRCAAVARHGSFGLSRC